MRSMNARVCFMCEDVWVPTHPTLRERLDKIQGRLLLIVTKTGRQYTESHFRHVWRAATLRAGLNG